MIRIKSGPGPAPGSGDRAAVAEEEVPEDEVTEEGVAVEDVPEEEVKEHDYRGKPQGRAGRIRVRPGLPQPSRYLSSRDTPGPRDA